MESLPLRSNSLSHRQFSKFEHTLINLINQHAFLKLTSNTAYLALLNYCCARMEDLHHIHIVVIDHITTQDNRDNPTTFINNKLGEQTTTSSHPQNNTTQDIALNDPSLSAHYFACSLSEFEQACYLAAQQLQDLNRCLDHPIISLPTTLSILNKVLHKGWLKQRHFD